MSATHAVRDTYDGPPNLCAKRIDHVQEIPRVVEVRGCLAHQMICQKRGRKTGSVCSRSSPCACSLRTPLAP